MFRESLEIALLVGIMLAYLHRTKNKEGERHIWLGAVSGIVASVVLAYLFNFVKGGFNATEPLFEGVFMVVTAGLVTWLILWMLNQKKIVENLQNQVKIKLQKRETIGLFLLAFTSVFREGVEAVLFMFGIYINTGGLSFAGAILGIVIAVILGILMFEYAVKFKVGSFLKITTILLILLAAGLFSRGLMELQEAKVLPVIFAEKVYTLPFADGNILSETGIVGGSLKGLIGYSTSPSDLQILGYITYLAGVYFIYQNGQKN